MKLWSRVIMLGTLTSLLGCSEGMFDSLNLRKSQTTRGSYALSATMQKAHLLDGTGNPFWIIETDGQAGSQKPYDTRRKSSDGKPAEITFNDKLMVAAWGQYIPGMPLSSSDQPQDTVFQCNITSGIDVYIIEEGETGLTCSPVGEFETKDIKVIMEGTNPTFAAIVSGKAVSLNQGSTTTISATTINGKVVAEDWLRQTSVQCPVVDGEVNINILSFSEVSCGDGASQTPAPPVRDENEDNKDDLVAELPPTDEESPPLQTPDPEDGMDDTVEPPVDINRPITDNDRVVIGYYESWAQWRRNLSDGYRSAMTPADIDPTILTHIYFAFMSFGFEIFDYDQNGTVTAKNPHNTGDYRIKPWEDNDLRRLGELKALKNQNPNLKLVVSLGGWNFNLPASAAATSPYIYSDMTNYLFSDMIADVGVAHKQSSTAAERVPCTGLMRDSGTCVALKDKEGNPTTSRKQFTASVIEFLRSNDLDGIDLDWEYPGVIERGGRCQDFTNYGHLLREMHEAFEKEAQATGKPKLLLTMATSAAVPSGICPEYAAKDKYFGAYASYAPYLDWIGVMTYDFYGAWSPKTGPNAPPEAVIDPNTNKEINEGFNVTASMSNYLTAGFPASKLVVGMGTYGRNFSGVNFDGSGTNGGFGSGLAANGSGFTGASTGEAGLSTYFEILNLQKTAGWTMEFDTDTKTPYMYNIGQRQWIGFDNEESLEVKCNIIKNQEFRGGMIWSITNDDHQGTYSDHKFPLVRSIHSCLRP